MSKGQEKYQLVWEMLTELADLVEPGEEFSIRASEQGVCGHSFTLEDWITGEMLSSHISTVALRLSERI